jgi:hypothetical protein
MTTTMTNKTDCHDITEILLKVALNTINLTKGFSHTCQNENEKLSTFVLSHKLYIISF